MLNPDDDIENLYRDFAENYPLEPGDSGWDNLLTKMDEGLAAKTPAAGNFAPVKKYWYALVAILMVLISSTTIFRIIHYTNAPGKNNPLAVQKTSGEKPVGLHENKIAATKKAIPISPLTGESPTQAIAATPFDKKLGEISSKGKDSASMATRLTSSISNSPNKTTQLSAVPLIIDKRFGSAARDQNIPADKLTITPENKIALSEPIINNGVQADREHGNINVSSIGISDSAFTIQGPAGVAAGNNMDSATKAGTKSLPITTTMKYKKNFYLSLLAGPDISTVKFQSTSAAGLSAGFIAGIQLSKRLSIESGVLVDKKNYFSSGKYFDKNSAGVTDPDDQITAVNGIGNFVEVPVIARINILQKRKSHLFAALGLSSYLTERERYTLNIQGSAGPETHKSDDDDWRFNLFSLLHLSAGYQFIISAHGSLQVEPYLKLPFSGIGRGSLPITSTGIYLRYTHTLFK